MYKQKHFSHGGVGALLLLSVYGTAIAQTQPIVTNGSASAAFVETQNAKIGELAVAAWRKGFKTGDFGDFIEMLDNNVEFRLGIPPHNVIEHGRANAIKALIEFQALTIRVDQMPVTPLMINKTSTTFEFDAIGTVAGKQVRANLLVVFEILNSKIVRIREYTPPA